MVALRDLPGPKAHGLAGHFREIRHEPLEFLESCRAFGGIAKLRFGPFYAVFLTDPALVEQVLVANQRDYPKSDIYRVLVRLVGYGLVTSQGELWRRQRRLVGPAFDHRQVQTYAHIMASLGEQMLDRWQDGETRNLHADMAQLTLAIVAKALFSADVSADAGSIGVLLGEALQQMGDIADTFEVFLPNWAPTPRGLRLRRMVRRLDRLVYNIIHERRQQPGEYHDLLTTLLAAHDDAGAMSDQQLRDEVMTLVLAGHETTALGLTWGWYLLAQQPEAQERLAAEAREAGGDQPLTIEHLPRLEYARAVWSEALRLYPPAAIVERQTAAPAVLGGVQLPRRTIVMVSQWVMQRHPDYWERPNEFVPERWQGPDAVRPGRGVYFPFGGGARMCIGESFASMEGVLLLAAIARRFRFRLAPAPQPQPRLSITLRPRPGPVVSVERRSW